MSKSNRQRPPAQMAAAPLTDRARAKLFGAPLVDQPHDEVVRRIQIGHAKFNAEKTSWPKSAADVSPLAAALAAATKRAKS